MTKSPFPGMDPYIEACGLWGDFHEALIYEIKSALADVVPDRYVVRSGERYYIVLVQSGDQAGRSFLPDVSVEGPRLRKRMSRKGGTAVALPTGAIEPVTMRAFVEEEHRESFIEIREPQAEHRLVTSIELLSPSNKRPNTPGWEQYQRKRQSLMLGKVNLVEIDLLRGGQRMPMLDPWPDTPYTLLVTRPNPALLCKVWGVPLLQPLPALLVPLANPDPDIPLELQPLIEAIYQRFHYERTIDYARSLLPALPPDEAAWLRRQLRPRPRRS